MANLINRSFWKLPVVIFCVVFLLICLLGIVIEHQFLLEPFASTDATIIGVDPGNSARLYCSYNVGGVTFTHTGLSTEADTPGAKVKVFYLLSNPAVSLDYDPSEGWRGIFSKALAGATFMSGFLTLGALVIIFVQPRRRQPPIA